MYSCCFNSFDVKDTNLSLPTDMWLWVGITLMCNFVTSVCYMVYMVWLIRMHFCHYLLLFCIRQYNKAEKSIQYCSRLVKQ